MAEIRTIDTIIYEERTKFTNDGRNYQASAKDWDLGDPIGHGSTREKAIESLKEGYDLKLDKERGERNVDIEVEINVVGTKVF